VENCHRLQFVQICINGKACVTQRGVGPVPNGTPRLARPSGSERRPVSSKCCRDSGGSRTFELAGTSGRRQRYPAGVLAVVAGVAIGVAGAGGGVVVVAVASGADLTVSVPACSLATATAPMTTTAMAPITADSNLTFFCWSTLTTPFGPDSSATSANRPC
jgi:hypothetical protein